LVSEISLDQTVDRDLRHARVVRQVERGLD
jgi:hypothetical protein